MEDVGIKGLVHVATLPTASFFEYKERIEMITELIVRLMQCGHTEESAFAVYQRYANDIDGLLRHIRLQELFDDDRKEYV